jgi:hypothetical protein
MEGVIGMERFWHFNSKMPCAPVEAKGYKSVLKLSEWQTNRLICIDYEKPSPEKKCSAYLITDSPQAF